jgi:hypothetical protein
MAQATQERTTSGHLNGLMLMAAVVSAVSGLLYGYDTGIISGACCRSPRSSTPGTTPSR